MTSNNLKKTALAAVMMCTLCIAAYLGMPKEQDSDLLLANVEALTLPEIEGLYIVYTGVCPRPCEYKKWITCKVGGNEECYPSDCC